MPGPLVLAGSGEFTPAMVAVDEEALRHTPGSPPRVAILPTASGLEVGAPDTWIRRGVEHFGALGCEAYGVRALDRAAMEVPEYVAALASADFIYLSGGNPGYLVETLRDSAAWGAIRQVWERGGALAGCSAGAMAFGQLTLVRRAPDWLPSAWEPALGLLGEAGVIPHYDRIGPERAAPRVAAAPPGLIVLGIDEETAIVTVDGVSRVLGARTATVWRDGKATVFRAGETIPREVVALP